MCVIFHKWSKWKEYEDEIGFVPGLLAPKEVRGQFLTRIESRQKRTCEKCGKVQDVLVK